MDAEGARTEEPPVTIEKPNLLVVEGRDDQEFFEALLKNVALSEIQVLPVGGKTKLRKNLKGLVATENFHAVTGLGIVRDADADPADAFEDVRTALRASGLSVPANPIEPSGNDPRVTVMILPGGGESGSLEDLCLRSVDGDPAILCTDRYFECLDAQQVDHPQHLSKARVQTFLASLPQTDLRLGVAAQRGYWPLGHDAFQEARDFLRQAFDQ